MDNCKQKIDLGHYWDFNKGLTEGNYWPPTVTVLDTCVQINGYYLFHYLFV